MKRNTFSILTLLFLILFAASALHAGYKRDPWGGRTWTGPGRPPHWSPESSSPQVTPDPPVLRNNSGDRDRRHRGRRGSNHRGGYWKDKFNQYHYHRYRQPGYIYFSKPRAEKVIVERQKRIPFYIQTRPEPARLQCGGSTITSKDPKTGDLIIEYVTAARNC